ncbi:MAG: HupE/UreJ family protein [Myxococcota bacterium]
MRVALTLLAILSLTLADAARAHDPGLSSAQLRRAADRLETLLEFHDADLEGLDLVSIASQALILESGRGTIEPLSVEVAPTRERHTGIHLVHALEPGEEPTATLGLIERLPFGHKTYLRLQRPDGAPLAERILSAGAARVAVPFAAGREASVQAPWHFFALGIEHLLIGFDHVLFLLVVLLGCASLRAALRMVSAFTLGHSVSLAAATHGWLHLSSDVAEPIIAASIVYMAGLALLSSGRARERATLTFAFGLVHGLGFAGVLAGLGVESGTGGVALPLLSFNLGVEVGQLGIASLVLPALLSLRRGRGFGRIGVPACAGLAGAVGLVWLVERTLGA